MILNTARKKQVQLPLASLLILLISTTTREKPICWLCGTISPLMAFWVTSNPRHDVDKWALSLESDTSVLCTLVHSWLCPSLSNEVGLLTRFVAALGFHGLHRLI